VKFLVDNQLPAALARFLASRGVECQHVLDIDLARSNAPRSEARFIWIRFGNCRTKALLAAIERLWPKIEAGIKAGDRIIELR
jgi:predicted nuclease of predicted toxin-antitoxin system